MVINLILMRFCLYLSLKKRFSHFPIINFLFLYLKKYIMMGDNLYFLKKNMNSIINFLEKKIKIKKMI
jgi:hypothetical protein